MALALNQPNIDKEGRNLTKLGSTIHQRRKNVTNLNGMWKIILQYESFISDRESV